MACVYWLLSQLPLLASCAAVGVKLVAGRYANHGETQEEYLPNDRHLQGVLFRF